MTTEEKLDRLTDIVNSLASSVVAHHNQLDTHDRQIESLIKIAEIQSERMDKLLASAEKHEQAIRDLTAQWQAYLRTLPRQ